MQPKNPTKVKRCVGWGGVSISGTLLVSFARRGGGNQMYSSNEGERRQSYKESAREKSLQVSFYWKAPTPAESLQLAVNYQPVLLSHLSVNTTSLPSYNRRSDEAILHAPSGMRASLFSLTSAGVTV